MKKTNCQVCGGPAMPVYLRVYVKSDKDGKDHLQYVNFGTHCHGPECDAIILHGEIYRKTGQQMKSMDVADAVKWMREQQRKSRK